MQNCGIDISIYWCSQIVGKRSWRVWNKWEQYVLDFQGLLPAIREQQYIKMYFWQFCINPNICDHYGIFLKLHFNVSLSSNRGDKVLNSTKILLTQDFRVRHLLISVYIPVFFVSVLIFSCIERFSVSGACKIFKESALWTNSFYKSKCP